MASPVKIPARATKGQALYTIEQKLVDKEKKLTAQDKRRLQDQYDSVLSRGYAKGGDVKATTPKLTKKQQAKVGKVMGEFKDKGLHSGKGGPVVKNRKQAVAIALSEAKKLKKK
jgi:hypothetical protein